jgi:hypothetical protein
MALGATARQGRRYRRRNPSMTSGAACGFARGERTTAMKILLNQRSGLGNQLFQYAAGLYFARKYNATLEIIRQPEQRASSFGHPRPFLLSNFRISASVRERTLLDRLLRSKSRLIATGAAPVRRLFGAHSHDPYLLINWEFQPSLPLPAGVRRLYLSGRFQAYQYSQKVERQLRSELVFREPPTGKNLQILNRIRDCECPVSVHLRRGDYTVEWDGRNLLPVRYYDNAIAAIRETHPNSIFFVFSDDIASARESLQKLEPAVFVDHNAEDAAHEDLRLMSACRHHILANSTFSWWGAWLNPNPDKVVVVPDPWHLSNPHPNLIPPTWRCIQRQPPAS